QAPVAHRPRLPAARAGRRVGRAGDVSDGDLRDWARVRARFEELVELPECERRARLAELESEAPEVARPVSEVLAADDPDASRAFEAAIAAGAARVLEELDPTGGADSLA